MCPPEPRISVAPARPASRPAMRHRQDDQAGGVHAGVACRIGVGADGADLEAERAAQEQPPRRSARRPNAKKTPMWTSRPTITGRAAVLIVSVRAKLTSSPRSGPDADVGDELDRDVVEHDRRHHLVGTGARLEEAGDESRRPAPARHAGADAAGMATIGGEAASSRRRPRRRRAPMRNWPWAPMLKSPALKPRPTASPVRTRGVAWHQRC